MATPTFFLPHEALANEPTLLDRIQKQTLQRAQISRTTREEDVAQRTQAAYRMLEGIEEEAPTGGYGALFGQRASGAGFRTKEDAAAFLRATDPEGMTTRQQAVGEFMANQALPRLGTITDPAQRLAALKEMAASGPPMLNGIVSKIAADGVITDEEMAQAEGMFGGYRKAAESPWRVAGSNIVNLDSGEFRSAPGAQADVPSSAAGLDWAYRNPDNPAARAIIAKDEADRERIARANRPTPRAASSGSTGRARTSFQTINGRRVLADMDTGEVIRDYGPADAGGGSKPLSGTAAGLENRFFESMVSSANSATAELENIMEMPATATAGPFGLGSAPGDSVVRSGIDTLRNKLSSNEVQNYTQQVKNLSRALVYLETGGRATNESAIKELRDVLVIRENDNGFVVLQRLATVTQLIEKYLEPKLANPRYAPEQHQLIRDVIAKAKAAVPWTVQDVVRFERGGGQVPVRPGETFIEWARRSLGNRAAARPRLDTGNPFSQPFGTPAAPLNLGPAQRAPTAPAPAPSGGPTNIGRGITIERID
jgi:hypothetical protein